MAVNDDENNGTFLVVHSFQYTFLLYSKKSRSDFPNFSSSLRHRALAGCKAKREKKEKKLEIFTTNHALSPSHLLHENSL